MAWIYRDGALSVTAICIYAMQTDVGINDAAELLSGSALKLCTFKVSESVRGRKIGELFLKAAFRYATENKCQHIFIHANAERHDFLMHLLEDFGFEARGGYQGDAVMVKSHPSLAPAWNSLTPLEYARRYFPHYRHDSEVQKFVIPIQPHFHEVLFPDYVPAQTLLFRAEGSIGNAIKLAYLCHAPTNAIKVGDVVLFYRTQDEQAITSLGIVDQFDVLDDAAKIASIVSRRTVYSIEQIDEMATRKTKVILFRLVKHFAHPINYDRLQADRVVRGPIQSICKISNDAFSKILTAGI